MNWVTIIWSMIASACLTLAAIQLLVWFKQRTARASLFFSLLAIATAVVAGLELALMQAKTPREYGVLVQWGHLPFWVVIVSLVGFVRIHLRAGRPWLAWTICGLRTLSLILNFAFTPNLNYRVITGLRHISFLGESISVPEGVPNPWMLVGQLSLWLLVFFAADATLAVRRRGDRRSLVLLGGAIVLFIGMSVGQFMLTFWGLLHSPLTPSLFFLGIVAATAFEMSRETLRAEQLAGELRESEQQMTLATEAANLGVWLRDLKRNEIWASDRWRLLFGFPPAGRLDFEKFLQRVHPDDRNIFQQAMAKAVQGQGGNRYEAEYRVLLPDGLRRWIVSRGRVEFDSAGKPARLRGVAIDITHRKQTEMELGQQRNELAHLSRVTMLGELAGSLAHELNQPLTAILSNAQAAQRFMARGEPDLVEISDILADIVTQDKRAGEVIRRLRLLLKKGEVRHQPLAVNDLVAEVLKLVHSDLLNHGVTAHTDFAPNLPILYGDRVQLQQVLINLVMNASDAMAAVAQSERQLTVSTSPAGPDGISIAVTDVGTGINAEKLEQIFEPYFSTKPNGLGLGLAVCRSIITAHGGRLWASNNPERGATVQFTVPLGVASPEGTGEG